MFQFALLLLMFHSFILTLQLPLWGVNMFPLYVRAGVALLNDTPASKLDLASVLLESAEKCLS